MRYLIIIFFFYFFSSTAQQQYWVNVKPSENSVSVKVLTDTNLGDLEIWKGSSQDNSLGQIPLFQNIKTLCEDGNYQQLKINENGSITLPKSKKPIIVEYDVRLDFNNFKWNSGKEEMAFSTNKGYYFTGRSIFLWQRKMFGKGTKIQVTFHIPKQMKLTTKFGIDSYKQNGIILNEFTIEDIIYNFFTIGNFSYNTFKINDKSLLFVGADENLQEHSKTFYKLLSSVFKRNNDSLFKLPNKNYHFFFAKGDRNDGGAYNNGFAQTIVGPINEFSKSVWGLNLVHETLHLWNGRNIVYASNEEEWLLEGVTDYLSIIESAALSLINETQTIKKLENSYRKYRLGTYLFSPEVSIIKAGKDKNKNRMLIYGGGAMVAMKTDIELRKRSFGKITIKTVLQDFKEIVQEKNRAISNQDFKMTIEKYLDKKSVSEIMKMLTSTQPIDLESEFKILGLQLDIFGYEDIQLSKIEDSPLREKIFSF